MRSLTLLASTLATAGALATSQKRPLPLVIWHGLGDTYDSDGMQSVASLAQEINPGTYVHPIYLDPDASSDRTATFFGAVNSQLSQVCTQLLSIPELQHGFNAIGFSQGGQFLRGYIERCNNPPVKTLITFGSQHNGISDFFSSCAPSDFVCRSASTLLNSSKWSAFVQSRVVPAQYFRDPEDLESYLENSAFLADINNERPDARNETYARNLKTLDRFVMYMFSEDETVVPKESAWFAEVNRTAGGEVVPLEDREIYKQDWIGLRSLGERGRLEFRVAEGKHMKLGEKTLKEAFERYLGPGGRNVHEPESLVVQKGY